MKRSNIYIRLRPFIDQQQQRRAPGLLLSTLLHDLFLAHELAFVLVLLHHKNALEPVGA